MKIKEKTGKIKFKITVSDEELTVIENALDHYRRDESHSKADRDEASHLWGQI